MNRYINTEAIVIRRQVRNDSDYSVTLLTPQNGKITAAAKNIKTIKSHRLGSLQLGNIVKISLFQKNNYLWISECLTIEPFIQQSNSLIQYNLLFYFLEITNNLIADNQQIEGIYRIIKQLIISLNKNHFASMIQSEIDFINLLGFGLPSTIPDLYHQADYINCQKQIKLFFESIIEKKIKSNELFN